MAKKVGKPGASSGGKTRPARKRATADRGAPARGGARGSSQTKSAPIRVPDSFRPDQLSIVPATADRWPDLEQLFGERGACAGCWCMFWRKQSCEYQADKGAKNRASLRKLVTQGDTPGVLAYDGAKPIGWCAVAPRQVYVRLENSRVLAPVDETPVWSISCLFVLPPYRRRGVSVELVQAAVRHAAANGAKWVEAYPTVTRSDAAPGAFVWTGLPETFERAGFVEVARRSSVRPIYRMPTKPTNM
ncbi:MAG: GNAT family N-acetyltransferase [Phycisphaerae bacterium]|nr:GNAT family N-acetyltransferase [Phycisphaerae bacterium]